MMTVCFYFYFQNKNTRKKKKKSYRNCRDISYHHAWNKLDCAVVVSIDKLNGIETKSKVAGLNMLCDYTFKMERIELYEWWVNRDSFVMWGFENE